MFSLRRYLSRLSSRPLKGTGLQAAISMILFLIIINNICLVVSLIFYLYERLKGYYWPQIPCLARSVTLFTMVNVIFWLRMKVF